MFSRFVIVSFRALDTDYAATCEQLLKNELLITCMGLCSTNAPRYKKSNSRLEFAGRAHNVCVMSVACGHRAVCPNVDILSY